MDKPMKSVEKPIQRLYPNLDEAKFDKTNKSVPVSTAISDVNFETGSLDHTVNEFYEIFRKELPCLIVVDQGFCGNIVEDTFDKDQVILLNALSAQRRVMGRIGERKHTKWISIPWNYHEMLRLVTLEKVGKPKPLADILKLTKLPCKVMFPEKSRSTVGSTARRANDIPIVELTEVFDEIYFLGHFVNNGQLDINIITVPLYLSQLKFKLITGFWGKPGHEFDRFMEKMKLAIRFLNYDVPCGNSNIAEYKTLVVRTGPKFPPTQPNIYTDIMTIASGEPPPLPPKTKRPLMPSAPSLTVPSAPQRSDDPTSKNTAQQTQKSQNASAEQGAIRLNEPTTSRRPPPDRPLPPLPNEKQQNPIPSYEEISVEEHQPDGGFTLLAETVGNPPCTVPAVSSEVKTSKWRPPPPEPDPDYGTEPKVLSGENKDEQQMSTSAKHTHDASEAESKTTSKLTPTDYRSAFRINVKALAIDEVCECLTKLNLRQFQKVFRDNLIDGNMLIELDSDMLTTYMGMNRIEALRLVKFAESGIIPS